MKKIINSYLILFIAAALFVLNSCNSTGIFKSNLSKNKEDINELILSFSGDIMAHDVNFKMKDYNRIYDDIKDILLNDDLTFGNVETPVCEERPYSTFPSFNIHRDYLKAAIDGGFDVFAFANNHTNDQGIKGIDGTIKSFAALKEEYKDKELFSSGLKNKEDEDFKPVLIEKKDWKILFLSITELVNSHGKSKQRLYYSEPTKSGREKLLLSIKKMREETPCDIFILSLHLNEAEYGLNVLKSKKTWFKALADAGVDIVWAHHPHVLQDWEFAETESNKNVFFMYSMGNFISGQRWKVNYADPAYYREYTGDSIIMQLKLKKIDGILQSEMEAKPVLITNYNEKDAPVIKRFTKEWIETLSEKERVYYLKRLELMKAYLPKLK
ncbi:MULTISPECIES: CapA family protein [unclassified Treponema]|uniref:CapA family protein n=1 Tax=unclassified Treponema TaxID=2638727 RepID=UPI0020A46B13|nr:MULTISPECIES: CapA family protein [unclassified Treponema]UTC68121.1 CapA family protein [Treponema sp. OMZ 789]UTC70843.1 CapA family protein [Treponema sp. OMZ 790]UTC73583.1 CapA family protein [Treponema sp. OMZ 791]